MDVLKKLLFFALLAALLISISTPPALAQDNSDTAAKLAKQKERFEQRVGREFGDSFSVYETEHWLIASDASEELVSGCGVTLEKCYRLYFKLMKDIMAAKERSDERMLAFIFSKEGPKRAYYAPGASAIFVSMRHSRGYRTLFHEATHQLQFERSAGRTPDWLAEGLAMYFESYVEIEEGKAKKVKGIVPIYLGDLKEQVCKGKHVKVSELVGYSYEKFHGKHELLNYCESGALVHFLLYGRSGAYREKFKNFIQGKGKDDLYSHLGLDKDKLEKEFLTYVPDLVNYTDKLLKVFMERYKIAHEDVGTPEFHICLARVLRLKGDFDGARKELEKAAEKDREGKFKVRIRYNEGVTLHYEGKWREARKVLEEAAGEMPGSPQIFYFLAGTCQELQDFTAAERYYEKSVAIEPDFFAARYELSLLYLNRGKTKKAIKHLEVCIKLKPVQWTKLSEIGLNFMVSNIREILAIAYIQDRQYDKAARTLEDYLSEDPTSTGYYHLGLAYSKVGKKKEALDALDKALGFLKKETAAARRLRPNLRTVNAIADLYAVLGEEEKALSALEIVKDSKIIDIQTRATMAKLYARQGKIEEALKEVDEIAGMKPASTFELEDIAVTLKNLKEYEASEKVYIKALKKAPENQYLLYNFGVLYWKWKKYRKALAVWEKALAIDPGFSEARKWADKARKKLK